MTVDNDREDEKELAEHQEKLSDCLNFVYREINKHTDFGFDDFPNTNAVKHSISFMHAMMKAIIIFRVDNFEEKE